MRRDESGATSGRPVAYEQAVYGSFAFWHRGYALLAQSPGCRAEWLADFRAACQRYGERPPQAAASATGAGALFALRLPSGPWAVVGVAPQGLDDRGRPGALAFHALFLSGSDYRRCGSNPFALAGCLRADWGPETADLPAGRCAPDPAPNEPKPGEDPGPDPAEVARIVGAIQRGRRVAVESDAPIDALARAVWAALPERTRRRKSLATMAFGVGNRFDLVAVPRLSAVVLDASYAPPDPIRNEPNGPDASRRRRLWPWAVAGALALTAGVVAGLAWPVPDEPNPPAAGPEVASGAGSAPAPPPLPREPLGPVDADERARVATALARLAGRFGVDEPLDESDLPALMAEVSGRVRYRGPLLSEADRAALRARVGSGDAAAARALALEERLRRFVPDRPLPPGFAAGPVRWQLDTLAWSFHLDDWDRARAARLAPEEVVQRLGEALALDLAPRPMPLADEFPALSAYARFLDRLPRG